MPTWRLAQRLSSYRLTQISAVTMFAVPLLARLASSAEDHPDAAAALLGFLDSSSVEIPLNQLRVFWASASLATANLLHILFAPQIFREYDHFDAWSTSPEAEDELRVVERDFGKHAPEDRDRVLREKYAAVIRLGETSRRPALTGFLLLYTFSGYLLSRVALSQFILVLKQTSILKLLF